MFQGGGRHLEDIKELEQEKELMKLLGKTTIPDSDTIGNWLRRMGNKETGQKGLEGLNEVRNVVNHRIMRRDGISGYTLDADATGIFGEKETAHYTYKGEKGYMPVLGFLYENNLCINDEFREGNISPADRQKEFYEECKKQMPKGKKIKCYRADSASYQAQLINLLEDDFVRFGITADQDSAVKAVIKSIPQEDWKEPISGCGYQIAETVHCMNKTKKAFRLVVKKELRQLNLLEGKEERIFYHAIAMNWTAEEKNAAEALAWHNQRGTAENFNKELKNGFGMERMPCGQTEANAVYFRIGVIAYNLFIGFKRLSCPESWLRHTIATFRWKLIQVAGRIVKHAGEITLKLSIDAEKLNLFKQIRANIFSLKLCADG
jgi:hypothetical protein